MGFASEILAAAAAGHHDDGETVGCFLRSFFSKSQAESYLYLIIPEASSSIAAPPAVKASAAIHMRRAAATRHEVGNQCFLLQSSSAEHFLLALGSLSDG